MAKEPLPDVPMEVPPWDVALEALVTEEQVKLRRPLHLADFQRLALQYAIRLDDIMVTMFELCIRGLWNYRNGENRHKEITRELLEEMTAGGRLRDQDLIAFSGDWEPHG